MDKNLSDKLNLAEKNKYHQKMFYSLKQCVNEFEWLNSIKERLILYCCAILSDSNKLNFGYEKKTVERITANHIELIKEDK